MNLFRAGRIATGLFLGVLILSFSSQTEAASAVEIEAKVKAAMEKFYREVPEARELVEQSQAVLVFPSVIKAGIGFGGEYGQGALQINGQTVDYYSTTAASIGFQLGVQSKAVILLFIAEKALTDFRSSKGWEVGVDGSVALVKIGAGGALNTHTLKEPIIGFVFGNKGFMFNLTLEGTKISKIQK